MKQKFNRIIAWHEKNLPAGLPYEPLPQIGFLIEELGEVNKEFIKGDIDAAVGEITDLIVFSVNAELLIECGACLFDYDVLPKKTYKSDKEIVRELLRLVNNCGNSALFDCHPQYLANNYFDLIDGCCECIKSLGYSPEIALEQTVLKIESRRGAWNDLIGKWAKEKNQEDVYKPDYSLAKLNK